MLQRLKLGTKLTLVVALSIVGLLLATTVSYTTLQRVRINSPRYNEIIENQQLIADVLPPPSFVVEPYLIVQQLVASDSPVEAAELVNRLLFARTEYFESHDRWEKALAERKGTEDLRKALLEDSHSAALGFWQAIDERFLPAIERGDRSAAALLADGPITDSFQNHRTAIDRVVALSTERGAELEARTDRFLNRAAAIEFSLIGLLILAIGFVSAALVRSIRRPLRRLTAIARRTADEELPTVVDHFETSGTDEIPFDLTPIDVSSRDEIGALSTALSSVRTTAVELAARQAITRRNVNEMFVNLGRRNSSLINRQLSFIDGLERNEDDPRTLEELYRLDHLATRMRRNAESLLVLAGSDSGRRQSANAEVVDLLRASLSEIEDYRQVELQSIDLGIVKGRSVSDVIHLFAELLENATAFSPPNKPVLVHGRRVADGYVVSIVDEGVGMTVQQLADANRRIESPDTFDVSPSKVLGLYVVGRLAARHKIGVRLTESAVTGVTSRIFLPASMLADAAPLNAPPSGFSASGNWTSSVALPADVDVQPEPPVAPVPPRGIVDDERELPESPWTHGPADDADDDGELAAADTDELTAVGADETGETADEAVDDVPRMVTAPPVNATNGSSAVVDDDTDASDTTTVVPSAPPVPTRSGDALGGPAETLTRRTKGAQLPDTGAAREKDDAPERSPDEVKSMLGKFYSGVRQVKNDGDDADGDGDGGGDETDGPALQTVGTPELGTRDSVRQDKLLRRVRGAQMPDTGAPRETDAAEDRSPDQVRSMLENFKTGVDLGREETSTNTSNKTPEES